MDEKVTRCSLNPYSEFEDLQCWATGRTSGDVQQLFVVAAASE